MRNKYYPLFTWVIRKTYPLYLGKVIHFIFNAFHLLPDPMSEEGSIQMSDLHAGLALYGFENLEKTLDHRRKIAKIYADNLPKQITSKEIFNLVNTGTNLRFPIFTQKREKLINYLKRNGVYVSDIWYDSPVAPVKYLGLAKYPKQSCPNAEKVSSEILNLPTHINVSEQDAKNISGLINKWIQK